MTIRITKPQLVEIGAIVTSVYGVLTTKDVLNHLPLAISAILTSVGPIVVGLFAYLNHPSTGTNTVPVTTANGAVVNAPVAPVQVLQTPGGASMVPTPGEPAA